MANERPAEGAPQQCTIEAVRLMEAYKNALIGSPDYTSALARLYMNLTSRGKDSLSYNPVVFERGNLRWGVLHDLLEKRSGYEVQEELKVQKSPKLEDNTKLPWYEEVAIKISRTPVNEVVWGEVQYSKTVWEPWVDRYYDEYENTPAAVQKAEDLLAEFNAFGMPSRDSAKIDPNDDALKFLLQLSEEAKLALWQVAVDTLPDEFWERALKHEREKDSGNEV